MGFILQRVCPWILCKSYKTPLLFFAISSIQEMRTKRDAFGILSPYRSHCSLSLFAVYYTGKVEVLLVCQMGINL